MPDLVPSLSGFFADEYARFHRGLRELGPNERERRRAQVTRDPVLQDRGREISLPRWDDVVHLRPRTVATSEQFREWRRARALGEAPNLTPEVVQELDRRQARRITMEQSVQPEYARAYGSMMTSIDNVQDFLASVSILGRIALRFAPRIGLRTIPGVGTAKTLADFLNIVNAIAQLGLPAFALICHGARDFLAAGIGTGLNRFAFKGGISLLARMDPRALLWKRSTFGRVASKMVVIGQALTIAQTTDQLFGFGISLGPIVGSILEGAYAYELRTRGEQVQFAPSRDSEDMHARIRARLRPMTTTELRDHQAAAAVLHSAPAFHRTQDVFTPDEHLLALAALLAATETIRHNLGDAPWWDAIPGEATYLAPPPRRVALGPPWWLLEADTPPRGPWRWPLSDQLRPATAAHLADDTTARVPAALDQVRDHLRTDQERAFLGALVVEATESLWLLLEGDGAGWRLQLDPSVVALERMAQVNLLPASDNDRARLDEFWKAAVRAVADRRGALQTRDDWTALARAHSIELALTIPPDADHTIIEP